MRAVLISIKPQWCDLIATLKKTIEIRKTKPNIEVPFKVYIYCTQDKYVEFVNHNNWRCNGKIIGEFICDNLEVLFDTNGNPENYITEILPNILKRAALTFNEFQNYVNSRASKNSIYGWHISNLVIYDKPKELGEFRKPVDCHRGKQRFDCEGCWDCEITRPPQSWCYVESLVS